MIDVIVDKTHTADYLLHKYWSRKPHNVLRELISNLIEKENAVILDPFCGSGVFLRETSKLGHTCYGFDVNPIASILADVTCNPPNPSGFKKIVEPILEYFRKICEPLYLTSKNEVVRYFVHETIVECKNCKQRHLLMIRGNHDEALFRDVDFGMAGLRAAARRCAGTWSASPRPWPRRRYAR